MAEPYVGEIRMFGGDFAPTGWALCDGSVLSINANEMLYSLLGTTYGGDGQTTFGLPDLRGRVPMHQSSTHPLGQKGGTETVTLTQSNLATHTHAAAAQGANGTVASPGNAFWAGNADYNCFAPAGTATDASFNAGTIAPAGGSQPHENMMPFVAINFIIATQGIYPSFD
jgi:microcystin-dependent protein